MRAPPYAYPPGAQQPWGPKVTVQFLGEEKLARGILGRDAPCGIQLAASRLSSSAWGWVASCHEAAAGPLFVGIAGLTREALLGWGNG